MRLPSCGLVLIALPLFGMAADKGTPSPSADVPRVESLLKSLTLDEKLTLLGGDTPFRTHSIPRLGIPFFQMADGPAGAHIPAPTTAYAAGIGLAASWDAVLAEEVGRQLGRDARSRGAAFLLGPGVNIYRTPLNGRNFEYFGEDPYLGGKIAVGYIQGVQSQEVAATVKHFLGNNSEFDRHESNSVIGERTMREIYAPIFEASVKEGHVGALMTSYNLTNCAHMSESPLNVSLVKGDWRYRGLIMSDWVSLYSTLGPVNNGLDLEMPYGEFLTKDKLLPLLHMKQVNVATLDDKVRRLLRTAVRFRWLDRPQMDLTIPRYNWNGRVAALRSAVESAVLLKNESNLLPLRMASTRTIALIGPNATPAVPTGGGSGEVVSFDSSSLLAGLTDELRQQGQVLYARGLYSINQLARLTTYTQDADGRQPGLIVKRYGGDFLGGTVQSTVVQDVIATGPATRRDPEEQELDALAARKETDPYRRGGTSSVWEGYYQSPQDDKYAVFVQTDALFRLLVDGKVIFDNAPTSPAILNQTTMQLSRGPHALRLEILRGSHFGSMTPLWAGVWPLRSLVDPQASQMAAKADVVVVAAGFNSRSESEGGDRGFALPLGQEELIHAMSAANPRTVVALITGGAVDVSRWESDVPAIFELWYPGERGGEAFAQLLFGDANPSGHLPISWDRRLQDNPSYPYYYEATGTKDIIYGEGIFVGYRGYDHFGRKPQYPFGFGLSYSHFDYSDLLIHRVSPGHYAATFTVRNMSDILGAAVPQLYVAETHPTVERPPQELKGFARVVLRPGEVRAVTLALSPRAFSFFDVKHRQWHANAGDYQIRIGESSRDLRLIATVRLDRALDVKVDAPLD